ncbi:hypothetical protein J2W51_000130 [Tardiphaga robiniae]|nr:hypothetical protein [Tardiphaga robiniae]
MYRWLSVFNSNFLHVKHPNRSNFPTFQTFEPPGGYVLASSLQQLETSHGHRLR